MISGQRTCLRRIGRDHGGPLANGETSLSLTIETLDGTPIGRVDVEEMDPRHRSAQVMLSVSEPNVDGQGLGPDALAAVCRYLFDQRCLHRVGTTVFADDNHAVQAHEQIGFRREGVLRDCIRVDGALRDEVAMSLLAGELRA